MPVTVHSRLNLENRSCPFSHVSPDLQNGK